jgi:hypothetical protein
LPNFTVNENNFGNSGKAWQLPAFSFSVRREGTTAKLQLPLARIRLGRKSNVVDRKWVKGREWPYDDEETRR